MLTVVTSFSRDGYDLYGSRFIDSFLSQWPKYSPLMGPVKLCVATEGFELATHHRAEVDSFDLTHDPDHERFVQTYNGPRYNHPSDFNEMSVRFCHKVFAITSHGLPNFGWRTWIDADVTHHAPPTEDWFASIYPEGRWLSYLGRNGMMRPGQRMYSECGFVGYNVHVPQVRAMLGEMRAVYNTGRLFKLGRHNWHDSYVFDLCRKDLPAGKQHNIAARLTGKMMHPWEETDLQLVMDHHKGPARKRIRYGREHG